ncbi:MAG: 16S rRNA (adenine(1518)-N(6)/adenine(1519)-N(6))-dimethyltransferase RsmA [Candidatus Syntrophosphaera sp.]
MRPKKSLGQHFLINEDIARQIVDLAQAGPTDTVWEIGPGRGILTRALLERGCQVKAFELDRRLEQHLRDQFGPDLELVIKDILQVDWEEELSNTGKRVKIIANIPYNITSPLLSLMEKHHQHFESATLMVQEEVARRICASPGTKAYGVMTLRLQRIFDARILMFVTRENFQPVPEVDSAVLSLKQRSIPPNIPDLKKYLLLISQAFAHRRKTLRNNLATIVPRDRLDEIQRQSGIDLGRRGETLSETEFITLSRYL